VKKLIKIFTMVLFASLISGTLAQESPKDEKVKEHKMEMKHKDHKHMDMKDHKNMKMDSSKTMTESLVRDGEIDLKAIDKNKDGKVFQDTMDWNVISDEAGDCPLCGMKLKEVTLENAKENLIKNGFKIKEK